MECGLVIIWGDSREVLPAKADVVDLVLTSPPYNVGIEYEDHDDLMIFEDWRDLVHEVLMKSWAKLREGGRMVVNIQYGVGRNPFLPLGPVVEQMVSQFPGALHRGPIVWHAQLSGSGYTSWGSWLSPSNPVLRGEFEMLYVFSKGQPSRSDREGPGDISRDEFLKATRDVWDNIGAGVRTDHPAPFPVELARRVIQLYSWPGDHVLDPFAGEGTTGVAAEALGREWTMIEISRAYCEKMAYRIPQLGYEPMPITEGVGGLG